MISAESLAIFILACLALCATPGPNVALIVGTSLKHGRKAGMLSALGVNVGIILQLAAVAAGLSWLVDLFARHFDVIRYLGAAYLIWLAVLQWRGAGKMGDKPMPTRRASFGRGFAVAFANPKTLLFHAAFLPQFVTNTADPGPQIALLAAIFALIALVGDMIWAVVADRARAALAGRFTRIADRVSAGILAGGALVLLAAGRR
ncbi:homoserine/homoserine lactone/threonine efflux protein [Azorhizobium caulinodans ORS 571]|uniref:Homoserine/homoserine lactone/threonine efflux protein n=1 Tax=Azorhizobium caulinodans (strain ATCC 43989 / DSM 5975 / JCM 20966 / LMG 6465 / NBRC 14845 / NCIMB 13405 / ORS 571) TaxID=438753 RepID=A8I5V5_AZOC5|nr:LysE family translocator [Azorhizobium caulinodans]BAF88325.1 homoserine/homoserine lactone/threonine efflux protein [Azorhizobium caulinodans ORS 571]